MKFIIAVCLASGFGFVAGAKLDHPVPVKAGGFAEVEWVNPGHDRARVNSTGTAIALSCVHEGECYVLLQ